MKKPKGKGEEKEKALSEEEKLEKPEEPEKLEKAEEPEPEKPEEPEKTEEQEKLSDAVVYKHNFANCHLTLSSPEETGTQSIGIILQKPIKKLWGFYRTTDEKIKKGIEKSHYFGRESGFRILVSSEAEAKKGEGVQVKSPKYKPGAMSGIK